MSMEIFPDVARSLSSILEMRAVGEDISDLCLTFDSIIKNSEKSSSIKEGMEVTNDNIDQYVEEYIDFELNYKVKSSFEAFKNGFYRAYPGTAMLLLDPSELDIVVSGEEVYDWATLKSTTKYIGATERSRSILNFWNIFDSLSQREKLKFITG